MVRAYTDAPVTAAQLARITSAGSRAPSAGAAQGQRFVIVTSPEVVSALADAANEEHYTARGYPAWLSSAPAHIAVCVDPTAYAERYRRDDKKTSAVADEATGEWVVPYWWVDAGASLMAILLAAVDEGLASGFLGAHAIPDAKRILSIPEEVEFVGLVTVGHPAPEAPRPPTQRGVGVSDAIVHHDAWTT